MFSVANLKEEQKAQAVAVVCGVNSEEKLLGLGLKQSETKLQWASSSSSGYNARFTPIICTPSQTGSGAAKTATFTGDLDGSDNWNKICEWYTNAASTAATNYPAFNWVSTYGVNNVSHTDYKTGWYIPSIAELTEIYRNKAEINKAITKLNEGNNGIASSFKDDYSYWSSSQHGSTGAGAWALDFSSGCLDYGYKHFGYYVCCVRAF